MTVPSTSASLTSTTNVQVLLAPGAIVVVPFVRVAWVVPAGATKAAGRPVSWAAVLEEAFVTVKVYVSLSANPGVNEFTPSEAVTASALAIAAESAVSVLEAAPSVPPTDTCK